MIVIALTGSIGMGKSTTAGFFVDEGCAFYDADASVHRLYAKGGGAVGAVGELVPAALVGGAIDRTKLAQEIARAPEKLARLESIVHPLVGADRAKFMEEQEKKGARFVVLDVPLLFETGGDAHCDYTVVVSANEDEQRRRVLARPAMDEAKFHALLARQIPDAEKRARADFVISTSAGLDPARQQVREVLQKIAKRERISLD